MRPPRIGLARCAFARPVHRFPIVLERVMGHTHLIRMAKRPKWIEADVGLQDLDRSCGLACIRQGLGVSEVDEIGVELQGALKFGDGGIMPALENQDSSKRSASFWQACVKIHSRFRQFKGAIERSGTEIIAIERFEISEEVSSGQQI